MEQNRNGSNPSGRKIYFMKQQSKETNFSTISCDCDCDKDSLMSKSVNKTIPNK